MMRIRRLSLFAVLISLVGGGVSLAVAAPAAARTNGTDTNVTVGSPRAKFPRNKQNEPSVGLALNPTDRRILVAGANEEIDNAPCNGSDCSFTPGVTDNGVYFSLDGGRSWVQPTYTGWTARNGTPHVGRIGTVPWYYESGLVGDGDPATAFGPRPGPHGFSWANGARLYYGSLTSNFGTATTIRGFEAISVSRTDDVRAAARSEKAAWMRPVIVSGDQTDTTFSDKDAVWADNAASSRYFGNAYSCWTSFKDATSVTAPAPIELSRSADGGSTWSAPALVSPAVPTTATTGTSGCTIRTDSRGVVYVFWEFSDTGTGHSKQMMARSFDGGLSFEAPRQVADVIEVGKLDPVHVANGDPRLTFDGIAGARTGSFPSVDVANGAPTGRGATNEIVLGWADGRNGLNHEQALVQFSHSRGTSWSTPSNGAALADRPNFPAVAIAPNGSTAYLVYDAFLTPWRATTHSSRIMQGVVRQVDLDYRGGGFRTLHRGQAGDPRGSSENNLCCEFLGDYNYAAADNQSVSAVWNDVRDAAVCPVMNDYRQSFLAPTRLPKPAPATDCPPTFGNSDIYGGTFNPY
jgi:hypothetical protein